MLIFTATFLITYEFLYKNSLHSMDTNPFLLSSSLPPQPPLLPTPQPSAHLVMSYHSSTFSPNRGRSHGNQHPNKNRYNHQNRGQSVADWRPNNWQQNKRNTSSLDGQWSGQQHVCCQLCSNFGHTAPHCPQFHDSTQQPFAHLTVGNVSAATWSSYMIIG